MKQHAVFILGGGGAKPTIIAYGIKDEYIAEFNYDFRLIIPKGP